MKTKNLLSIVLLAITLLSSLNIIGQTTITSSTFNFGLREVIPNGSGNFIILGTAPASGLTLPGCSGSYNVTKVFAGAYDQTNNCWSWVYQFPFNTTGSANPSDMDIDGNGNVFFTGAINGTVNFNGSISKTASGFYDMYIMKISSAGTISWVTQAGTSGSDYGHAIKLDNSGNVYVSGIYNSVKTNTSMGHGVSSIFMGKYKNSDGTSYWVKTYAGYSNFNFGPYVTTEGKALTIDASGNVYQVGTNSGSVTLTSSIKLTSSGSKTTSINGFVIKYNSNGTPQWAKNAKDDFSYTDFVQVDGSGNVYTAGSWYTGTGTINFGNGVTLSKTDTIYASYITKYNNSGTAQWARKISTKSGLNFKSLMVSSNNNIFASVYSSSLNNFVDMQGSSTRYYPSGQTNFIIGQYSTSGNFVNAILPVVSGSSSGTDTYKGGAIGGSIIPVSGGFMITGFVAGRIQNSNTYSSTLTLDSSNSITASGSNVGFIATYSNALFKRSLLITENENEITGIKVYPNPANDILFIESSTETIEVSLTDLTGKVIMNTVLSNGKAQIDLNEVKPGIYFLKAGSEVTKILKK